MLRRPAPARTTAPIRTTALALTLAAAVLAGCAGGPAAPASTAAGGTAEVAATTTVEIAGDDLVLVPPDGERLRVASLEDGELLHAAVRPGQEARATTTVLALARTAGRYELRYVNVVDGAATDLYWFPYRLQVAPDTAEVADVATLPVWAPDGSAVAWLEWDADGTRLRTVGWLDHDAGTNPSDDQATYAVAELPTGSQLAAWEVDADGTPVLTTRGAPDARWRIRLEDGQPLVALDAA